MTVHTGTRFGLRYRTCITTARDAPISAQPVLAETRFILDEHHPNDSQLCGASQALCSSAWRSAGRLGSISSAKVDSAQSASSDPG